MFLLPYHVDVPMSRWPFMNFAFMALTVLIFFIIETGLIPMRAVEPYILQMGEPNGIYGHMFLHAGYMHLFGNMMFLWVFGNAVCAKVSNIGFVFIYMALGCLAGLAHLFVDGGPAIGASGAVNGVVGMYLVLYPRNNVTCFYWFFFRVGTFSVSGIWIILYRFAFDIYGAVSGGGNIAYWAHIGGFAAGFLIASLMLYTGLIEMGPTEESLYDTLKS